MLQDIIDSKDDAAVLSFFLVAPERSFSAEEVGKRLLMSLPKAVAVLNTLATHGQLVSFVKKNKKYYLVNTKYKLMPEIKASLIKNGIRYQDELFLAIKKLGVVQAAFLSGIFTGYATLPVDLLLVGKINLQKLSDFLAAVEKLMGQEINYSVMSVEEFIERRDTFDRFIKDIFDYRHLVVVDQISKKGK